MPTRLMLPGAASKTSSPCARVGGGSGSLRLELKLLSRPGLDLSLRSDYAMPVAEHRVHRAHADVSEVFFDQMAPRALDLLDVGR